MKDCGKIRASSAMLGRFLPLNGVFFDKTEWRGDFSAGVLVIRCFWMDVEAKTS